MSLPHVRTNLGDVRPHTLKVAEEITHRWTLYYVWGIGGSGHHAAGRALDLMVLTASQGSLRTRVGNEIAAYLQDNADRLGILYIIWRQRIWNDSRSDDRPRTSWREWRRMADRGSPTENHMDHVHVSFRNNPRPYRPPEDDMDPIDVWREPQIKYFKGAKGTMTPEAVLQHLKEKLDVSNALLRKSLKDAGVDVDLDEAELAAELLPGLLEVVDPEAIAAAVAEALPDYQLVKKEF